MASSSVTNGSVGVNSTPQNTPASASSASAAKRSLGEGACGSMMRASWSSAVVTVIFAMAPPAAPMALSTSMSRVISALFVSTDTPKPNSSISSNAPRVTRRVRSNGLYVSDMAPTPTMPRTRRLRSSRRRMANASNLTLTWSKSSMR